MTDVLTGAGFDCTAAATGDEARTMICPDCRFDILVSDIKMPGRTDGIELAEHFTAMCPHRPALLLTGYADGRKIRFPVLQKPLIFGRLIPTIRQLVDKATS